MKNNLFDSMGVSLTNEEIKILIPELKKRILNVLAKAKSWHPWASLSSLELFSVLYFWWILRYDINNPTSSERDYLLVR